VPCPGTAADGAPCPGQFRLDGLLRVRENGQTVSLPCMDCGELYEISLLLTGFTVPTEPLTTAIEQMHYQIAGIATGVSGLREQAAELAATVRRIHRVVSAEVTDCPRFFTLGRKSPSLAERAEFYRDHYQLSLWCEHPGHEHPWDAATYDLDPPKEWLVRIAPYVRLVFRTLQLVVPVATAIDVAALPSAQQADAQARLAVMQAIVTDLPIGTPELGEREFADRDNGGVKLTPAEGQALRAVRQIVFENDPLRAFGDMRRVQSPAGDLLWVCPVHYPEYDPGLPTLL
jgi:internalin A